MNGGSLRIHDKTLHDGARVRLREYFIPGYLLADVLKGRARIVNWPKDAEVVTVSANIPALGQGVALGVVSRKFEWTNQWEIAPRFCPEFELAAMPSKDQHNEADTHTKAD